MAKAQSLRSQLATAAEGHFRFDTIGVKKDGNIVVRRGYYYRSKQMSSTKLADSIVRLITATGIALRVVDHGEQWKAFRGGASIANQSHFWVELTAV